MRVEIIDKKEFTAATLNADNKTHMMYVVAPTEATTILIYSSYQAQVASVTSEKTRISTEYFDFSNIFSLDSAAELPKHTRINNHFINLLDDK